MHRQFTSSPISLSMTAMGIASTSGFFPILKTHGGRFITYDDAPMILEGEREGGRTVIIGFDSEAACLTWWNSPEYRELAAFRHASTTTHSVSIIHAPPGR